MQRGRAEADIHRTRDAVVTNGQLSPIKDERDIRYRLREREGEQLIVAQRGLINIGVMLPSRWATEGEAEELWQMAAAARTMVKLRKQNQSQD